MTVQGRAMAGGRWGEHNAERRRVILEAAVALIEEAEPGSEIPLQAIADRAGVKRSVIYRHFADRPDLDAQIREFAATDALEEVTSNLVLEGTLEEVIFRVIDTYVRMVLERPRLHAWIERGPGSGSPSGHAVITGTKAAVAEHIASVFTVAAALLGKEHPGIDVGAATVVSMVDGGIARWLETRPPGLDATQLTEQLASSIWYLIDGHARALGIELDRERPISELLADAAQQG
ncbi:TetR/AcrR family transcriptional regulator [Nocardia sp. NPDC020380]|uniref:TetR/AcrR family transcriptional regulator n=1 Tax=Nocardia sp. NPDC020380 TaxID=3364309 RepID=UPI0037BA6081